jgi:accessory gene regulator B
MERLANNIASRVAAELSLDKDKREVVAYGAFAILQMLLSIMLVIIFGVLFQVVIEALIISFTASILRKYSGGVHASSPSICTFIGTIICVGQAVLISLLIGSGANLYLVLMLGAMIFIWSYYLIYKLAPVDSAKKAIVKEEKRKLMKKGSILILSVYLIVAIIFIILYISMGGKKFLFYALCLYSGILWQVFTLTAPGHLLIGKIDTFLNHRS